MSPINAAMRLNCGESWFRSPVLNGEPCVGSEDEIVSMIEQVQHLGCVTVGIEVHDPVHFCIWRAIHVISANVFSGLRVRPDRV